MSRANDPAAPAHGIRLDSSGHFEVTVAHHGLTIREHFAAMAMQGLLAHFGDNDQSHVVTASCAVQAADALVAELAKERT